tara:strand:- start:62 stop:652 length:591 start_codon:yes stop_codon:yes gene_type:complete
VGSYFLLKIYTKTGDEGKTDLFFGGRVSKNDLRCEAYGETDSSVSAMGLARALCADSKVKLILRDLQNQLFTIGAELATLPENYSKMKEHYRTTSPETVKALERTIDELESKVDQPPSFIIPGASPGSAALDLARSNLRSAERRIIDLDGEGILVNKEILSYINRLSDLLFMLARYEDRALPTEVITGQKIEDVND